MAANPSASRGPNTAVDPPASRAVDLEDLGEMRRDIDHDPAADHLPGQRGPRRPRDEANSVLARKADQLDQIGLAVRDRHRERFLLVGRGVCRVDGSLQRAQVEFAVEAVGQLPQLLRIF